MGDRMLENGLRCRGVEFFKYRIGIKCLQLILYYSKSKGLVQVSIQGEGVGPFPPPPPPIPGSQAPKRAFLGDVSKWEAVVDLLGIHLFLIYIIKGIIFSCLLKNGKFQSV